MTLTLNSGFSGPPTRPICRARVRVRVYGV